jgi:hypothetical protein
MDGSEFALVFHHNVGFWEEFGIRDQRKPIVCEHSNDKHEIVGDLVDLAIRNKSTKVSAEQEYK